MKRIIENYFYHYYSIDMEEDRTAPAITIEKDDPKEFLVRINGSAKNDRNISISLSKEFIFIKNEGCYGNKKHSSHQREEANFERIIPLPEGVIPNKAKAYFDEGSLYVKVPKIHDEYTMPLKISNG